MKICPNTNKSCEMTGCSNNISFCQYPNGVGYTMGWECPRCHKIHSPFATHCECPPHIITSSGTTNIIFNSECNHIWIRTTKNYKRAWKCFECKKVVTIKPK